MLRGFEITRSKLIAWVKRHLLISTAIGIFLGYIAYQLVTTVLVVCRDAYVTADIVAIAPEVSGPMATLGVTDNQPVEVGTLLFTIDPRPFQIELDRENAALELARANFIGAKDRLALAESDIEAKKASFDDAVTNRDRGLELFKESVVSQEAVDNLERAYKVAQAELNESRASRVVAEQEVAVQSAQVQQVQASVAKAQWELSRTEVKSEVKGRVAPFVTRPGSFLQAGRSVLAIVTNNNWRVVANLPERHLYNLRVGQQIWLSIGSGPRQVHTGRIRSIAPGVSRSEEATTALPYVKPNTEWIRLPRRFPVEIDLDDLTEKNPLYMGANATVWWLQW